MALVPLAMLLSGAALDWPSPALTAMAAILTGAKLVAVAWAVLDRASKRPRSYCGYYGRPSKHEAVVLERPDIDAARRGGDWSQGMDICRQ